VVPTAKSQSTKMVLKLRKNGDSIVATIPKVYIEELGLEEGDRIRGEMVKVKVDKSSIEPN